MYIYHSIKPTFFNKPMARKTGFEIGHNKKVTICESINLDQQIVSDFSKTLHFNV